VSADGLPGPRVRRPRAAKLIDPAEPVEFTDFHRANRGAYVRWAALHLGSRAEAEDAVDEAMLELLAKWPAVVARPAPAAYAWTVVKSRTIDAVRASRRRPVAVDIAAFESAALTLATDPIAELETNLALEQAIALLPERQHDVMVLRYRLGYTTRQTARLLDVSEATVRSTVRDARRRLARSLGLDTTEGTCR
jgi:RNA polymerase sigma-70 factor (ECF subfamily)